MNRSLKHFLLFTLIFFLMTLPFCFNDYLFFFCKQKIAEGVITDIKELHGGMSSNVEVEYKFEIKNIVYKSYSTFGYPNFKKTNLKVGDTVHSIEYCPKYPGKINRLKLYRYLNEEGVFED